MARQTTRQMTQKMTQKTAIQKTPRRILRLLDAGSPDGGYRFLSSTEGSRWLLRPTDGGSFRKVDPAAANFNATALSAVSQRRRGSKSGQSAKNTAATAT